MIVPLQVARNPLLWRQYQVLAGESLMQDIGCQVFRQRGAEHASILANKHSMRNRWYCKRTPILAFFVYSDKCSKRLPGYKRFQSIRIIIGYCEEYHILIFELTC